jgi:hypothetical protein
MAGELIVKRDGAVGTIVFDNVDKHNAVSYDMWRALPDAVRTLDGDPEIRVIVVTGAGEKAFVSGADIAEFRAQRNAESARRDYNAAVEAGYLALSSTDHADDRAHSRRLLWRRHGSRDRVRHADRRGGLALQSAGGAARPRLQLCRHQATGGGRRSGERRRNHRHGAHVQRG